MTKSRDMDEIVTVCIQYNYWACLQLIEGIREQGEGSYDAYKDLFDNKFELETLDLHKPLLINLSGKNQEKAPTTKSN